MRIERHYSAWRLVCAVPAILTSAMLVTVAFGWLGKFTLLGLVAWLAAGALLGLPSLERAAVRIGYRFHGPALPDRDWMRWLQSSVESRCQLQAGRFDWYVRRDAEPNAFAIGRRSVAVTSGFLQLLYSGRLTQDQAVAVGVHEAGHHLTGGARYGLAIDWLSWPWRAGYRLVMRMYAVMPFAEAGKLLMPVVFVIAAVMLVQEDAPPKQVVPVLVLLIVVALGAFVAPFADAAFARASEHGADAYAARLGVGSDLANGLALVAPCRRVGPLARLRNSHPATSSRLRRLEAATSAAARS
ncbi:MAG: M48 family metalloprotease [Geodermatophilaceae bacterium]|nr:M48 family metalloprotease [Geodermatophilaceae bacterium]